MPLAVELVLTICALVLCGYALARRRAVAPEGVKRIADFVACVAVPALLFRTAAMDAHWGGAGYRLFLAYALGGATTFVLAMCVGRLAFKLTLPQQAMMAHGATFSNAVMVGIPIVFTLADAAGQHALLLIVALHVMVYIPVTVGLMEIGREGRAAGPAGLARTALAAARNPLILSVIAGALWGALGPPLPGVLDSATKLLAGAAAPAALFALGGTLAAIPIKGHLREAAAIATLKLAVHPLAVWLAASYLFGLEARHCAIAVILAALPTGANPFVIANRFGVYPQPVAGAVMLTTLLSAPALILLTAVAATH